MPGASRFAYHPEDRLEREPPPATEVPWKDGTRQTTGGVGERAKPGQAATCPGPLAILQKQLKDRVMELYHSSRAVGARSV